MISPLAFIDKKAEIDEGVTIEPFAYIGKNVKIRKGTKICSHARVEFAEIGENNYIGPSAIIGAPPQDLKFKGEISYVKIGKNNIIREFVTIHRATGEGDFTVIGDNNFLMAYVHIPHNARLGNNIIIANSTQIAGWVEIEDNAFISGEVVIHQLCKIGRYSMIGGLSRIPQDVPPYMMVVGIPAKVVGINIVGLKRAGFSSERIKVIKEIFKIFYLSKLTQFLNCSVLFYNI